MSITTDMGWCNGPPNACGKCEICREAETEASKDFQPPLFTLEDEEATEAASALQALAEEFDARTFERHRVGAQKYGPLNFITTDTIEMAIEEILDMANYIRYTYIKLRLLQEEVHKMVQSPDDTGFKKA